jgi:nitroreductase/NAD-dependent dihydropyrimidine dehydrogenase PreA subunit
MSQIAVDTTRCKQDAACISVCPSGTLALGAEGFPSETPGSNCILCGHCVAVCSCQAISHAGLPHDAVLDVPKKFPDPALLDGLLISRRSVREFKDRPVPKETLAALLDVARRAPTASNSQNLHWIVVNGPAKLHALSRHVVDCLRAANMNPAAVARWDAGYDFVLRGAPTLVAACTPTQYDWGKQDCSIAITFFELAAEARGLGVCWAGYLTRVAALYAPLRQALAVPEGYTIHGALMLGEPRFVYRRIPPRKFLSVQWN